MNVGSLAVLALALGLDAFAVAVAVGIHLGKLEKWTVFRLAFHFGFAQFGMPLIGWRAGELVVSHVGSAGNWLAGLVLAAIGIRLIWEQKNPEQRRWSGDPTRGASLLLLMFATSVDALAAGLSLALVGIDILQPALVIGVVAAVMTLVGLTFGRFISIRFSQAAGVIGGLVLIGLAVRAFLE